MLKVKDIFLKNKKLCINLSKITKSCWSDRAMSLRSRCINIIDIERMKRDGVL